MVKVYDLLTQSKVSFSVFFSCLYHFTEYTNNSVHPKVGVNYCIWTFRVYVLHNIHILLKSPMYTNSSVLQQPVNGQNTFRFCRKYLGVSDCAKETKAHIGTVVCIRTASNVINICIIQKQVFVQYVLFSFEVVWTIFKRTLRGRGRGGTRLHF